MTRKKVGSLLIKIGLMLLIGALILYSYNLYDAYKANKRSQEILEEVMDGIDKSEEDKSYIENPDMPMPVKRINGRYYIGYLDIPKLKLSYPVGEEWNYPALRASPCRYEGSVYKDNLIICGHNYARFFGYLYRLSPGNKITFTDMNGNVFKYKVISLEQLKPTDVTAMSEGEWDLTLFTCTYSTRYRVTVRCQRIN